MAVRTAWHRSRGLGSDHRGPTPHRGDRERRRRDPGRRDRGCGTRHMQHLLRHRLGSLRTPSLGRRPRGRPRTAVARDRQGIARRGEELGAWARREPPRARLGGRTDRRPPLLRARRRRLPLGLLWVGPLEEDARMAGFSATTTVNKPIDQVFAFLADGENDKQFSPRVQEITKTTDGPPGVGTVFQSTVKDAGMTSKREFELTEFEQPRKIRWHERSKNSITVPDGGYDLEPDGATRLTIFNNFEGHGFGKVILPLAAR